MEKKSHTMVERLLQGQMWQPKKSPDTNKIKIYSKTVILSKQLFEVGSWLNAHYKTLPRINANYLDLDLFFSFVKKKKASHRPSSCKTDSPRYEPQLT